MTQEDIDRFERERPDLVALAYRMLGERAAAEDIVQEAWLRWAGSARRDVREPAAWLRRTTARLAIDALRSARARREVYVGPWLPEPLVSADTDTPDTVFARAEACGLALLWAMERLSPEERCALVLREAFDADYGEISKVLNKTAPACRQLVSRASRRVRETAVRQQASDAEIDDLLTRFATAAVSGERHEVLRLLAPDAVAVTDGGGKARAALRVLSGASEIAQVACSVAPGAGEDGPLSRLRANAQPALGILTGGTQDMILTVRPARNDRIGWIYVMRNPDKLPARKAGDDAPALR